MLGKDIITHEVSALLQFAEEELLVHTIWGLSQEQKNSKLFKEIGQQRYLSALRSGGIENALMTRTAFVMDPYFAKSKLAVDAARLGFQLKCARGQFDIAKKIKDEMGLTDELPTPPDAPKDEVAPPPPAPTA